MLSNQIKEYKTFPQVVSNLTVTSSIMLCVIGYLRNKSWKPECFGSFNMG